MAATCATHFIGIPMIVQAIAILLARPSVDRAGLPWSLCSLLVLASLLYYLRLDLRLGLIIGPLFVVAELGFLLGLRPALRDAVMSALARRMARRQRWPAHAIG